ncbi:MAG: SDR family NAD(P)-dependent oxidoreductase [Chitinispirillaceae bacterium]|nr:SDR family NAD(P)-dependent oxidoreductase [Chitinispirillaceae bacterium]
MKRILIIGASSGMGRELALLYARQGDIVGVTGRRIELLEQLRNAFPRNIYYSEHDIGGIRNGEVFHDIVQRMGGLDVLIISAGVGFENNEFNWELEEQTIGVNVVGFGEMVNIGYRYFQQQRSGHIVGISSVAGIRGIDSCPAYSASKAFISNYLEAIRKKAKKEKCTIVVTDIIPGFVNTRMAKGNGLFWVASVEKAAYQIARAIEKKCTIAYITKRWRFVAYILKCLPRTIYDRI